MYVLLRDVDMLTKFGIISKDAIARLGKDAIQLVLTYDKGYIESEIGFDDFDGVRQFFDKHVYMFDSDAEAEAAVIEDPDDPNYNMTIQEMIGFGKKVVCIFE